MTRRRRLEARCKVWRSVIATVASVMSLARAVDAQSAQDPLIRRAVALPPALTAYYEGELVHVSILQAVSPRRRAPDAGTFPRIVESMVIMDCVSHAQVTSC